jgi:hypothetical protein
VAGYTKALVDQIVIWKDVHASSDLYFIDNGDYVQICDLRPGAEEPLSIASGLAKDVFLECDRAQSVRELHGRLNRTPGRNVTEAEIQNHLERFVDRGFVFRDDDQYLTLALSRN